METKSAESKRKSAEVKLESFTNSIDKYSAFINEYKDFLDKVAVEKANDIISKCKDKSVELQKRLNNLNTLLQNSKSLSATEAESLRDVGNQLLSDIEEQSATLFKQRVVVAEITYAATEKKIADTKQAIEKDKTTNEEVNKLIKGANGKIVEAKQEIDEAKNNSSEKSLLSAESDLVSAEAKRKSAEYEQQSAEYEQQSAEYEQQSAEAIKGIRESAPLSIKELVKYYNLCIKSPETNDENEMRVVKDAAKKIIQTCKNY